LYRIYACEASMSYRHGMARLKREHVWSLVLAGRRQVGRDEALYALFYVVEHRHNYVRQLPPPPCR